MADDVPVLTGQVSLLDTGIDDSSISIMSIDVQDELGRQDTYYTDPSLPPPNPQGGGTISDNPNATGKCGIQLVIYNDPRTALETVISLGLPELL